MTIDVLDLESLPIEARDFRHKWLDHLIKEDPGLAVTEEVISRLTGLYLANQPAWIRCKDVLRRHGLLRDVQRRVQQESLTFGREGGDAADAAGLEIRSVPVLDVYPDAPTVPEVEVPFRWELVAPRPGPVLWKRIGANQAPVASSPLIISAMMVNVTTGDVSVELAWRVRHRWLKRVVPREATKSPRDLITAVGGCEGFPIDINNAKEIIGYLSDFEAHNEHLLPVRHITHTMGWVDGAAGGFVVGDRHVGGKEPVEYVPRSGGEAQLTRGVEAGGDIDGWTAAASRVSEHGPVMFALYSALATPLLEPLGAKCFIIDLANKTSSGKTTALQVAASAWGKPDTLVTSWDSTVVGFERRAAAMDGIPIFADDTKRAKMVRGRSTVPSTVYHFADGSGRVRGAVKGLDETASWRSILLSTGEQRILDIGRDGGVAGRVLTLWGPPFGQPNSGTAAVVRDAQQRFARHYGHAGPAVAEWLAVTGDWETLRREHARIWDWARQRLTEAVVADGADLGVVDRLSSAIAVVCLAAQVAHQALELPWPLRDPVSGLWASIASGAGVADREKEALRYTISWASQNRRRFTVSEKHRTEQEPNGGWLGHWEQAMHDDWEWIAVWPGALDAFLESREFEAKAIRRQWAEAGWLVQDDKKRTTARVNSLLGRPRMVKIKREVAEGIGDLGTGNGDQEPLPFGVNDGE